MPTNRPKNVVSIHPYFTAHPGQMPACRALLQEFVRQTSDEPGCLYYEFTIREDVIFCREAYRGAEGALAHLANVDALITRMLAVSSLSRLELHGPAAELDRLRGPLAAMNPEWYVLECGVK
jgi:quinol monooxygenase YgiN